MSMWHLEHQPCRWRLAYMCNIHRHVLPSQAYVHDVTCMISCTWCVPYIKCVDTYYNIQDSESTATIRLCQICPANVYAGKLLQQVCIVTLCFQAEAWSQTELVQWTKHKHPFDLLVTRSSCLSWWSTRCAPASNSITFKRWYAICFLAVCSTSCTNQFDTHTIITHGTLGSPV